MIVMAGLVQFRAAPFLLLKMTWPMEAVGVAAIRENKKSEDLEHQRDVQLENGE